jgi:GntR family transcriptional regulator, vanillate catabolism transcriptional regulator
MSRALANSKGRPGSQTLKAILGIRDLVFSAAFAPGERLSEPVLAERLGLSRTPIRAALARLEQEGLLEIIPSGGYTTRRFPASEVMDAIELRGVLEGTAARMAAERGLSAARLAEFHALNAEVDGIVGRPLAELDYETYIDRNTVFHRLLKDAAGSAIVAREIDRVMCLPFAGPSAFLNVQMDIPEFRASLVIAQSHHKAIVEAIEAREGGRAEAMAREHARLARRNLEFVMQDHRLADRLPSLTLVST